MSTRRVDVKGLAVRAKLGQRTISAADDSKIDYQEAKDSIKATGMTVTATKNLIGFSNDALYGNIRLANGNWQLARHSDDKVKKGQGLSSLVSSIKAFK